VDIAPIIRDAVGVAKRKPQKLSDQVRQAIRDAGVSQYRISQQTGIDASALSKFVRGQRAGLSMESLDQLGEYLGLTITALRSPKPKGE